MTRSISAVILRLKWPCMAFGIAMVPLIPVPLPVIGSGDSGIHVLNPGIQAGIAQHPSAVRIPTTAGGFSTSIPLGTLTSFERAVQRIAGAARVPIGLELVSDRTGESYPPADTGGAAPPNQVLNIAGLTVGEALTRLVAYDPRYEWFEAGAVINVRPKAAVSDPDNFLNGPISWPAGADTTLDEILNTFVRYFSNNPKIPNVTIGRPSNAARGSRPEAISAAIEAQMAREDAFWKKPIALTATGPRFTDLLNAAILAHGEATWVISYTRPPALSSNSALGFSSFDGFGASRGVMTAGRPGLPPAMAARPAPAGLIAAMPDPPLARIVTRGMITVPVTAEAAFQAAEQVAREARAPMVIEWPQGMDIRPGMALRPQQGLALSGLTVKDALTRLSQEQPLLMWQQGVHGIEVQTQDALQDSLNFLNARIPVFEIMEGTFKDVFLALDRFFGARPRPYNFTPPFNQNLKTPEQARSSSDQVERPMTVSLRNATVREILSAVAAAHREIAWEITWRAPVRTYGACTLRVVGFNNFGLSVSPVVGEPIKR